MEKQLFDWEEYDENDTADFMFYKVTLKQDIGLYKKGTQLNYVLFNYQTGILTINDDKFQFSLKYEGICE